MYIVYGENRYRQTEGMRTDINRGMYGGWWYSINLCTRIVPVRIHTYDFKTYICFATMRTKLCSTKKTTNHGSAWLDFDFTSIPFAFLTISSRASKSTII